MKAILLSILAVAAPTTAAAAPPPPLDHVGFYAFPGAVEGPASAVSAGVALADRGLGDEPYSNPAAAPGLGLSVSPLFLRVSRQDLRASSTGYDETSGNLDAAGGRLSASLGAWGFSLYAYQPVLRLEDNAFTIGTPGQVQSSGTPPGTVKSTSTVREGRAGLAVSRGWARVRLGVAGEWTWRNDSYDYTEQSGDPGSGTLHLDFQRENNAWKRLAGWGFQAGIRATPLSRLTVGAALRRLPGLALTGEQHQELLNTALNDTSDVLLLRQGGWEGGLSARYEVTEAFRVLAALGGRTARTWDLSSTSTVTGTSSFSSYEPGADATWSLGLDYHDREAPWTFRFGVGQEVQRGVPEPRAGIVALGLGWFVDPFYLDGAAIRRSLGRPGEPTSYDDRVLVGLTLPF